MELTFINGTTLQKAACRTAASNLLNLPFDVIPLSVTVEFVADPEPSIHNEFAWTEATYGSVNSYIRIDEDAPDWQHPWNGVLFLQGVFAHELGHAFYAALPEATRVAVAQMFGAQSDELGELKPPGSQWEDRILEGICETFKDAFLPQRFRKFAVRTNRRISINRYPEFRAHFRHIEQQEGCSVAAANLDFFNDDDPFDKEWKHAVDPADYLWVPDSGLKTYGGTLLSFWGVDAEGLLFHRADMPLSGSSAEGQVWAATSAGVGSAWVRAPQKFTWQIDFGPAALLNWANLEAEGGTVLFPPPELGFTFKVVVTIGAGGSPKYEKQLRVRQKGFGAESWEKESPFQSGDPEIPDPPALYSGSFEITENDIVGEGPCGQPFVLMNVDVRFNILVNDTSLGSMYKDGDGNLVGGYSLGPIEYYLSKVPTLLYSNPGFDQAAIALDIVPPSGKIIPGANEGGRILTPHVIRG